MRPEVVRVRLCARLGYVHGEKLGYSKDCGKRKIPLGHAAHH